MLKSPWTNESKIEKVIYDYLDNNYDKQTFDIYLFLNLINKNFRDPKTWVRKSNFECVLIQKVTRVTKRWSKKSSKSQKKRRFDPKWHRSPGLGTRDKLLPRRTASLGLETPLLNEIGDRIRETFFIKIHFCSSKKITPICSK